MNNYYDEHGAFLGSAWSFMRCWIGGKNTPEEHVPHRHDPEYAMYGPYMCPGFPERKVYDTPPRKSVN